MANEEDLVEDEAWEQLVRASRRTVCTAATAGDGEDFTYEPYPPARNVPAAWALRYARDADRHWEAFWARNARPYKERNYLRTDLAPLVRDAGGRVLEMGCGSGNALFNLPEGAAHVVGVDFAPSSVAAARSDPRFDPARMHVAVGDITRGLSHVVSPGTVDVVTLIFVLGSIPPADMGAALHTARSCLRPGGLLYFRDHARDDTVEHKAATAEGKWCAEDGVVVRKDKTLLHFFDVAASERLFADAGFEALGTHIEQREVTNRKLAVTFHRRFVVGVFRSTPGRT